MKKILLLLLSTQISFAYEQPVVSCHIPGQLGNQLYVIATTLAYAWDYEAIPYFPDLNHKQYRLSYNRDRIFFRLNASTPPFPLYHTYTESCYFCPDLIQFDEDLILDGFFQSWKYFDHHRDKLLATFAPSEADRSYLQTKYADLITSPHTVGVHVRTFNANLHRDFPFLGLEYYKKALALFPKESIFVVFSDRIDWCKHFFSQIDAPFVFIEGNDDIQDLFLMSLMKHNIIANSTYSWWGAYLNQNPQKIVVAPDTHYYPVKENGYPRAEDYFLPGWIVMPKLPVDAYPSDMTWYGKTRSLDGD